MQVASDKFDVGVIIGRFQVPELHEAHRELINYVRSNHKKVMIFLGLSPLMVTQENPLDYEARKQMLLEEFPDVNVLYIKDVNSDKVWSKRLDEMVSDLLTPSQTAVLYGGRDSFISYYIGKFPTRELEQTVWISGTEIRKNIASRSAKAAADFREGVIWASRSRFPLVISTVDVVVFNTYKPTKILLAKKLNEDQWRCIGGFTDPLSPSDEADARRETYEEANIALEDLIDAGSFSIDDWRYRGEPDTIRTHLFTGIIGAGQVAKAGDDIAFTKWFWLPSHITREGVKDTDVLMIDRDVIPEHRKLVAAALKSR